MFRRVMVAAVVAATAVVLTACSDDSGGDAAGAETTRTTETTTTTEEAADDTSSSDAPAPVEVEFTKPGTELKIGDKAVVPYERGGEKGALGITVTAIEKGTTADLAGLDDVKDQVPFFIRYTVTNESGSAFTNVSAIPVFGVVDGGSAGFVTGGGVDKCELGSSEDDFATQGGSYDACRIALGTAAIAVVGAEYDEDDSDIAPGSDYSDAPITWRL